MSRDICLRCPETQQNGEGGNRTHDTTIFSRVLYQLSYLAVAAARHRPRSGKASDRGVAGLLGLAGGLDSCRNRTGGGGSWDGGAVGGKQGRRADACGLPGMPPPFLGTAVVGSGGRTAAVDAYGNVVDLRATGPAGPALVSVEAKRQAAGTVPAAGDRGPRETGGRKHAAALARRLGPAVLPARLQPATDGRTIRRRAGHRRATCGWAGNRSRRPTLAGASAATWQWRTALGAGHVPALAARAARACRPADGCRRRRRSRQLGLRLAAGCSGDGDRARRLRLHAKGAANRPLPRPPRPERGGALPWNRRPGPGSRRTG
jgi:hypothetical protein